MDKNSNQIIKEKSEDRENSRLQVDIKKINNSNSYWYYASLVLINVISLLVCFLLVDNYVCDIQKVSIAIESFDIKLFCIVFLCLLLILFLKTIPIFLRLYSKTKSKKIFGCLGGVISSEFFGKVTLFSKGKLPMFCKKLNDNKYDYGVVIDSVYGQNNFDRFTYAIYSFVLLFVGIFLYLGNVNIILFFVAICILAFYIAKIIFIFMFNSNKKRTLEILSKIIKFAYKIGIIKDYEIVYNRVVDKLIIAIKDLKNNKSLTVLEFVLNILRYFLKASVVYIAVVTLNFADGNVFGNLLFLYVIFDLIMSAWPLQNGTLIYEIVFVLLFKNIFFEGYVFWGLLIFRIFDYFSYVLLFLIEVIIDKIASNKKDNLDVNK